MLRQKSRPGADMVTASELECAERLSLQHEVGLVISPTMLHSFWRCGLSREVSLEADSVFLMGLILPSLYCSINFGLLTLMFYAGPTVGEMLSG